MCMEACRLVATLGNFSEAAQQFYHDVSSVWCCLVARNLSHTGNVYNPCVLQLSRRFPSDPEFTRIRLGECVASLC